MAVFRQMHDLEYSDDEKYDQMVSRVEPEDDGPDYPEGLKFMIMKSELAKFCDSDCEPGMTIRFAAMGTATSIDRGREDCRIEVELGEMAGEDGRFVELDMKPSICLCGPELEKIDLEEECEKGDMIHIVGTARVERVSSPAWGEDSVYLQIVEAAIEDESQENRDA